MEVNKIVEDLQKSIKEIQATNEQKLKDQDALLTCKFNSQAAEFSAKLQALQDSNAKMEAEIKAEKDRAELLEAAFKRGGTSDVGDMCAGEAKAIMQSKEKFDKFMRGELAFGSGATNQATLVKAMSTDVNPDGGYLVRPELVDKVVNRNFETSPMRQVATVMTGSAKSIELLIDDDEADVNNTGEGSASSNTATPEVGILTITAFKYDAEPKATVEMLQDAYLDVESWLARKVADRITRKENTDFVSGNGVGKAKGFLSYTAGTSSYVRDTIEQVASGSSGAVTADGAISLQNSLHEIYQPNALFMMKRATYTDFMKLKDTNNQYLFGIDFLKTGQVTPTLLGKRVVFADDMPAIAADALSVAYGDFAEGYTIYDRIGLIVQRDPFTDKAFIKFYTYKRTGGAVSNYQAIKLMKLEA